MTVSVEEVKFCGAVSQNFKVTAGIITIMGMGLTSDDRVRFEVVYTPSANSNCDVPKPIYTPLKDADGNVITLTQKKNHFTLMDMEGFTLVALNENPVSVKPPCVVYQFYRG